MQNLEEILEILDLGNTEEKIKILENLDHINNSEILEKIILKLDDEDIRVRGEAFSSLVLNENKISDILIRNLNSTNKNIRGFTVLVLANRMDINAIPEIIKLTKDKRSMVRACAIGALGHLKAQEAKGIFLNSIFDSNLEVKKSSLQAIIDLDMSISDSKIKDVNKEKDHEIEKLLSKIKTK